MTEIDAEYALVRVHELKRIELKPRCVGQHGKHGKKIAFLAARERRNAEHPHPAGRGKHPVSFFPGLAADRVEDQFDTATTSDIAGPRLEILGAIVDEVVDAESAHLLMLSRRCSADHARPDMLGDLRRGDADTAPDRMDEDGLEIGRAHV